MENRKIYIANIEEGFDKVFLPKFNHIENDEDILHFETFGEELEFVKSQPINKVWTIVDGVGEDTNIYIVNGFLSPQDSVGYVVTQKEWKEGFEYKVLYHEDNVKDEIGA